jgi:hypothetical protein
LPPWQKEINAPWETGTSARNGFSMKSPLKRKPLRNAGDSVEEEIQRVVLEQGFAYYIYAAILALLAALEWFRWVRPTEPNPWLYSMFALAAAAVATYKLRTASKKVKNLKLGRDGEKAVGQFLERLRERGAQVIHDFPGEKFNIDHVVVHQSGVYAIETKTYSKPDRGEAKILFDGQSVRIPGRELERDPVRQARAQAKWLQELILENSGKRVPVRPVVVFPGWFVVPTAEAKSSEVWVLNPKALPAFIEHSDTQLPEADVHLVACHLTRYVRDVLK